MRRAATILTILALSTAAAPATVRKTFPARFVGDWVSSPEHCRPGTFDEYNVRITRRSFEDLNGRIHVRQVTVAGADALYADGRIRGKDYDSSLTLALADEGRTLVVGAEEDTSFCVRCKR